MKSGLAEDWRWLLSALSPSTHQMRKHHNWSKIGGRGVKRTPGDDGTEQKNHVHPFLPNPEAESRILTSKPPPVSLQQLPVQHLGSAAPFFFILASTDKEIAMSVTSCRGYLCGTKSTHNQYPFSMRS